MQSWCKTWPLNGFSRTRTRQKLPRRRKGVYESSSNRRKSRKLCFWDNSLEFGKSCEDLSWNHRTSTPHRSETNGIAERAVRRVKEGKSAVLLQSGSDERWWSDSVECHCQNAKVSEISWQKGKLRMKDDVENHSKSQSFRLEHWLNIIRCLRKTSQGSSDMR